ncbi:protein FAM151B-like [Huso huso]|uniref:Protein FAM151B-like n=1 Tax=Huso huso TaxID=61971 RepID=A0ABR1A643_HUSHU
MACIASCGGHGVGAALDYFINKGQIPDRDGGQVTWYHAANSKASTAEALKSAAHMIEADVLLRGREPREPIMAHPPHSDSDITLQDWLNEVLLSDKGIKLDFKSLEAVQSSIRLLESVKSRQSRPLWINADILPGPNGSPGQAVEAKGFLDTVCPVSPHAVLSLGWTTGWSPQTENHGYSWEMVKEMEQICGALQQPVTFPVRAALLRQSFTQLHWLLQQSDRYSLSVWTGKDDVYPVEDLLYLRKNFDKSRIFYDITEAQDAAFKKAIGYSSIVK